MNKSYPFDDAIDSVVQQLIPSIKTKAISMCKKRLDTTTNAISTRELLSSIVRVSIEVQAKDNGVCAESCPFFKFIRSHNKFGCGAFHKYFDSAVTLAPNTLGMRRLHECLEMFTSVRLTPQEYSESDSARTPAHADSGSESEHTDTTIDYEDDEDFELLDTKIHADDLDVSDSALGLNDCTSNAPLDDNDPVIKDPSWILYRNEEPQSYTVVAVYGIHFTATTRAVERLRFMRVLVMPCSDTDRKALKIGAGLGYGKLLKCGRATDETVEIHRWRKTKAYTKGGK